MLHYEALRQLCHEHRLTRELEAHGERLALEARGRRTDVLVGSRWQPASGNGWPPDAMRSSERGNTRLRT